MSAAAIMTSRRVTARVRFVNWAQRGIECSADLACSHEFGNAELRCPARPIHGNRPSHSSHTTKTTPTRRKFYLNRRQAVNICGDRWHARCILWPTLIHMKNLLHLLALLFATALPLTIAAHFAGVALPTVLGPGSLVLGFGLVLTLQLLLHDYAALAQPLVVAARPVLSLAAHPAEKSSLRLAA